MSINRVNISGNLTRDPELRATQGGSSILRFGIAVNDRRRNAATGEWEDMPNFVDCVVFGNRAEPLSRYLAKGMKAAIEGKLRWSQWEKDGQKRSKIEVIVDEIEFLSQQKGQQMATQAPPQYAPQQPQMAPQYAPQQAYQPQQPPQAQGYAPAPTPQQQAPAPAPQQPPQAPMAAQQPTAAPPQQAYQPQQPPQAQPQQAELYDEDIPF